MVFSRRFGLVVFCIGVLIMASMSLGGCGTVKRETSGGSDPSTSPVVSAECAWTTMNVTGLPWGSNFYFEKINGELALTYDYRSYYYQSLNRTQCIWNGSEWSAPVSGNEANRPTNSWSEATFTYNGSVYKAMVVSYSAYVPQIIITKDDVEIYRVNDSVYGDQWYYISLQVVNDDIYIAYINSGWGAGEKGLHFRKVNASGESALINLFIPNVSTYSSGFKVFSDTEAYFAYSNQGASDLVIKKWALK